MAIEHFEDNKGFSPQSVAEIQRRIEHLWQRGKWGVVFASSLIEIGFFGLGFVAFKGLVNAIDIDPSAYPNIGKNPAISVTIEGTGLFKDDFGLWGDISTLCLPDPSYVDGGKRIVYHVPLVIWNRDPDLFPDIPHDYTITCLPS